MLKFYVRHGRTVVKVHETVPFKQGMWLENYISLITRKRNKAKNDFENDFLKLLNNGFFGKMIENIPNRLKIEFSKNCRNDKISKHKSN